MVNPIFIVGASRSGTELVRSILNNSGQGYISSETHYFDDLRPRLKHPDLASDAADRQTVAAYFKALGDHAYGLHRDPEAEMTDAAQTGEMEDPADSTLSADGAFEAYCRSKATSGLTFWGEKTPRHVFRINDIKRAYPSAGIIFCCRDPRGVVASYRDWKNRWFEGQVLDPGTKKRVEDEEKRVKNSYSLLLQCLLWKGAVRSARTAQKTHGGNSIFFLKFEDLLTDPHATIETLCQWLGISYTDEMLEVMMVNSSYTGVGAVSGVSNEPRRRWEKRLSDKEVRLVQLVTAGEMKRLGYDLSAARMNYTYSAIQFVMFPFQIARAFLANRHRIPNVVDYVFSRALGRSR